jgi:hypothetical protein
VLALNSINSNNNGTNSNPTKLLKPLAFVYMDRCTVQSAGLQWYWRSLKRFLNVEQKKFGRINNYCKIRAAVSSNTETISLLLLGNGNSSSLFVSSLTKRQSFASSPCL